MQYVYLYLTKKNSHSRKYERQGTEAKRRINRTGSRGTKDKNSGIEQKKREHWDSGLGDREGRMGDRGHIM
jgi:hypothetical protein